MATVAVAIEKVFVTGDRKRVLGTITLTGTYLTNGESVPPASAPPTGLGLEIELNSLDVGPAVTSAGQFATQWDKTNNKVKLIAAVDASPAANEQSPELANAAIPGGPAVIRFDAVGKGSVASAP